MFMVCGGCVVLVVLMLMMCVMCGCVCDGVCVEGRWVSNCVVLDVVVKVNDVG